MKQWVALHENSSWEYGLIRLKALGLSSRTVYVVVSVSKLVDVSRQPDIRVQNGKLRRRDPKQLQRLGFESRSATLATTACQRDSMNLQPSELNQEISSSKLTSSVLSVALIEKVLHSQHANRTSPPHDYRDRRVEGRT